MGYNKAIAYGTYFELYEYEKERISVGTRTPRARKVDTRDKDLVTSGQDLLDVKTTGKRLDNARRLRKTFRILVAANLSPIAPPLLVTLTYRDNQTELDTAYRHQTLFFQRLRYLFGKDFRFISVPEFQKRGAVHFHALVWGLSEEVFLQERTTRTIAEAWGHGFVFMKMTDGDEKLSFYLSKYMVKAVQDPRLNGKKSYVSSRNLLRPRIISGFSPIWPVLEDWVGVDNSPLQTREYQTKWLGKAIYKKYNQKKHESHSYNTQRNNSKKRFQRICSL